MKKPIDQPAPVHALGVTLKTLRERVGISQEDLADDCGLGRAHVSIIERGLGNPQFTTISKLLARLKVDFTTFGAELDANLRKRLEKKKPGAVNPGRTNSGNAGSG